MKNTKKMMTIGAAAVAALASNQVAKADSVETPVTAPEATEVKAQAQTETVETAKEALTQAETAAKATTAEVATQENTVKDAQATVTSAETELKTTNEAITTVKEAHAYSSDEGLKFLADETAKSEENLKTRTENAKNAEDALKEAQTQEASAQDKSKDAQSAVSAQEQALQTAKDAEAKAQKALDATSPAQVEQAVKDAESKEKAATTQVTAAETALKNAQTKDVTRTQNIEKAKTALETAKRENGVSDAEKKLADAKAQVSSKEQALTSAKSNATNAANKLATAKAALEETKKNTVDKKALAEAEAIAYKIIIPQEYATHALVSELQWFEDNEEKMIQIQNDYFKSEKTQKAYTLLKSHEEEERFSLDELVKPGSRYQKELAEFTARLLNDVKDQYYTHVEKALADGVTLQNPPKRHKMLLTDKTQELAEAIARDYSNPAYLNTIGDGESGIGHSRTILSKYNNAMESLGYLGWGKKHGDTITMLDMKYRIMSTIMNMLFSDTHANNGHAVAIISASNAVAVGIAFDENEESMPHMRLHILGVSPRNLTLVSSRTEDYYVDRDTNERLTEDDLKAINPILNPALTANYTLTFEDAIAKASTSIATQEAAVKSAETAKAQADAQVKSAESALATAKFAQNKAQEAVNAAKNKVAQLERAYQAALAVKEETPQAQARVAEAKKALETAKTEVAEAIKARDNFAQTLDTRKQALKDAQAKVAQETASLKPLLEKAIQAEKEAQAKTEARKTAEQAVLRAQMMLSKAQEDLKAKKAFEARAIAAKEELPKLEAQKAALVEKIKDAKIALEAALEKLATAKEADAKAQAEYQAALKRYNELRREKDIMDSLNKQFNVKPGRNGETTATPKDAPVQEELPEFHPEVAPTRPQIGVRTDGQGIPAPSGEGQVAPQVAKPSYSRVASRHGLPQTGDKGSALAGLGFLGLLIGLGYKRRQSN